MFIPIIAVGHAPILMRMVDSLTAQYKDKYILSHLEWDDGDANWSEIKWKIGVFLFVEEELSKREDAVKRLPAGFAHAVIATGTGYRAISPYARLSEVDRKVTDISLQTNWGWSPQDGACHKTLFLSPVGGVGTTTFSKWYAAARVQEGKRTLWIGLDPFQVDREPMSAVRGWNALLLSIERRRLEIDQRVVEEEIFTQSNEGYWHIPIGDSAFDFLRMEAEDWMRFFEALQKGAWDEIVVDDSLYRLDWSKALLSWADNIVIPCDARGAGHLRILRLHAYLRALTLYEGIAITASIEVLWNDLVQGMSEVPTMTRKAFEAAQLPIEMASATYQKAKDQTNDQMKDKTNDQLKVMVGSSNAGVST